MCSERSSIFSLSSSSVWSDHSSQPLIPKCCSDPWPLLTMLTISFDRYHCRPGTPHKDWSLGDVLVFMPSQFSPYQTRSTPKTYFLAVHLLPKTVSPTVRCHDEKNYHIIITSYVSAHTVMHSQPFFSILAMTQNTIVHTLLHISCLYIHNDIKNKAN